MAKGFIFQTSATNELRQLQKKFTVSEVRWLGAVPQDDWPLPLGNRTALSRDFRHQSNGFQQKGGTVRPYSWRWKCISNSGITCCWIICKYAWRFQLSSKKTGSTIPIQSVTFSLLVTPIKLKSSGWPTGAHSKTLWVLNSPSGQNQLHHQWGNSAGYDGFCCIAPITIRWLLRLSRSSKRISCRTCIKKGWKCKSIRVIRLKDDLEKPNIAIPSRSWFVDVLAVAASLHRSFQQISCSLPSWVTCSGLNWLIPLLLTYYILSDIISIFLGDFLFLNFSWKESCVAVWLFVS